MSRTPRRANSIRVEIVQRVEQPDLVGHILVAELLQDLGSELFVAQNRHIGGGYGLHAAANQLHRGGIGN